LGNQFLVSEPVRGTGGAFITLARVVKTQGRRGEVAAEIHTDVPDRFLAGMSVLALPPTQSASPKQSAANWKWKRFGHTRDYWF